MVFNHEFTLIFADSNVCISNFENLFCLIQTKYPPTRMKYNIHIYRIDAKSNR